MVQTELVGYLRKSRTGDTLKLTISVESFENAQRHLSQDGREYVTLCANTEKVLEILEGTRDVTSILQIISEKS